MFLIEYGILSRFAENKPICPQKKKKGVGEPQLYAAFFFAPALLYSEVFLFITIHQN